MVLSFPLLVLIALTWGSLAARSTTESQFVFADTVTATAGAVRANGQGHGARAAIRPAVNRKQTSSSASRRPASQTSPPLPSLLPSSTLSDRDLDTHSSADGEDVESGAHFDLDVDALDSDLSIPHHGTAPTSRYSSTPADASRCGNEGADARDARLDASGDVCICTCLQPTHRVPNDGHSRCGSSRDRFAPILPLHLERYHLSLRVECILFEALFSFT